MELIKIIYRIIMGIGGLSLIALAIWQVILIIKLHNLDKD